MIEPGARHKRSLRSLWRLVNSTNNYGLQGNLLVTGRVKSTERGPEKYVVEYQHDGKERVARKIVRANTAEDTRQGRKRNQGVGQ
jgi:hypothetical protein